MTVTDLLKGETAVMKLYRDVADADDNYPQDVGVTGVEIKYTRQVAYTIS